VSMKIGSMPFPFPAEGPYADPADPTGDTLSITLWVTPDEEEVRASYQRDEDTWKLSSLSLVADGQRESFDVDGLESREPGSAARLRAIIDRVGLAAPRELRLP